jgi:hypothetical protein
MTGSMTESRNRLMATVLLTEIALHSPGSYILTPEADLEVADA